MHYLPVEKMYTCLRRDVDENIHILSRRQALIKFELRVCTERRPIALLRVLPGDFPFLPFPFSQGPLLSRRSAEPRSRCEGLLRKDLR